MGDLLYFGLENYSNEQLKNLADEILLRDQLDDMDMKYAFCLDMIDLNRENYLNKVYEKYKNKLQSINYYYEQRENIKNEFKDCKDARRRKILKNTMDEIENDILTIVGNSIYPLPEREKVSLDSNILEVKNSIDKLIINSDMSDEEMDIYFMLRDGYTYKEIAENMHTNHLKIHTKIKDIKNKLMLMGVDYDEQI